MIKARNNELMYKTCYYDTVKMKMGDFMSDYYHSSFIFRLAKISTQTDVQESSPTLSEKGMMIV
jgi:hypothetical protein